ncbi:MAG: hypothetical protein BIFFINMI_01550 [Phycisphaerae bacterium]|nr:hypothetical protein [Phycisphaerae bacterium]
MAPRRMLAPIVLPAILAASGCVIPEKLALPRPVDGYGHTYRVEDDAGKPVANGLLYMISYYHANDPMIRAFEIKNGVVKVPSQTQLRASSYSAMGAPIIFLTTENPYGTYMYAFVRGHAMPGGFNIAPWNDAEFLDGSSPPPETLRLRRIVPAHERQNLVWARADIRISPYDGDRPDDAKARARVIGWIQDRLAELPPDHSKALLDAIGDGNAVQVSYLVRHGTDPDLPNFFNGWRPLFAAVGQGRKEIAETLIQHGAQVNVTCSCGGSPLIMAVANKDESMVRMLLAHEANVNLANGGMTPLHAAVRASAPQLVQLLLDRGADPRARDDQELRPLELAEQLGYEDCVRILRAHPMPIPTTQPADELIPVPNRT